MRRDTQLFQWSMVPVAVVLVLLLGLAVARLRHGTVDDPSFRAAAAIPALHPGADQVRRWMGWPGEMTWRPLTHTANPFFTMAIRPAAPPPAAPPPAATKKVDITYRGYFQTSAQIRRAVVQVGEQQVLGFLGDVVVADYAVAAIELRQLILTNVAGQTVPFEFSRTQPLEIPAQ